MDWSTLIYVVAAVGFFWFMMRGCGMAAGGCGAPKRRSEPESAARSQA